MTPPVRGNILKVEMLFKKNRHILTYVSVFFVLTFSVIVLSSFKPMPKTNLELYFPDNDDTIYLYDTVYYYDTTYVYDTVYLSENITDTVNIILDKPKNNIFFKGNFLSNLIKKNNKHVLPSNRYLFSFDFSLSPMYSYHNFSSDFIYDSVSNLNKSSVQEGISRTMGLGINFHKPLTTFSSGIYYTNYRESFNYLVTDFLIDTILAYSYSTTSIMQIDSTAFINIDTLLATGDTIYYYFKDTNYITSLDSALVPKIDSIEYKRNDKANNSYSYIEIPLIFNFNFNKSNISISPQIGIITSFFMDSNGKIVSLTDINQSADIENEAKFAKINFSIYGGVRVNYFLTRRFDFFTSAYFRKNLNSIFIDYPIVSRFNTFGLRFGFRYKMVY